MSRAKEYRSRKRERLSKLTVEATGETFIVRRVAIDAWIMAGRLPETLASPIGCSRCGAGAQPKHIVDPDDGRHVVRRDLEPVSRRWSLVPG
jgi:hypothetical protein